MYYYEILVIVSTVMYYYEILVIVSTAMYYYGRFIAWRSRSRAQGA